MNKNNVVYNIVLSTTEQNNNSQIKIRQSDDNTQIFKVKLVDNSQPKDFDGLTPFFCLFPRGTTGQGLTEEIVQVFDGKNGTLEYTLSANAWQYIGRNEAYFSFRKPLENGTWDEQYSTKMFIYQVEKSIHQVEFRDSNYWWTFKELMNQFKAWVDGSKNYWENFLEASRTLIESIDGGGSVLEMIDFKFSKTFNKWFKTISDRGEFWDEKILETERKTTSNDWLKDLNGSYIAHKGFTAMKYDGPIKEGLYPDNSRKSFEAAGNLGYKAIETDLVRCKDGFIISHEENTMLLDGPLTMFKDMTISEIKERNIIKQPIGGGAYATLTGTNANYKILTLEECFDICKRFNMYIILDVRFMTDYKYTQKDIDDLVKLVRDANMEKFCMWYGNSNYEICDILKDSTLAIASINETDVEGAIAYIKKYNNYTFSVGETSYLKYADYAKKYDIPLMVWTIDEYYKADDIFLNGANCILTNRLLKNTNIEYLNNLVIDEQTYFRQNGIDGTYKLENDVHKFETNSYISRYHYIPKNTLNKGDIVRVRASGRTLRSDTPEMFARIVIDNDLKGAKFIRSLSFFKTNNFEEKEVFFVVTDVNEDININFGLAGGGFIGSASCEIKDVAIDVFTNVDIDGEAFGFISCYNGSYRLRSEFRSKGIKSVKGNSSDKSILEIEYDIKRFNKDLPIITSAMDAYSLKNANYKILPMGLDSSLGILKIKFLDGSGQVVSNINTLDIAFTILIK